jgi:hypothetical protein
MAILRSALTFVADLVTVKVTEFKDRYENAIISAVKDRGTFQFKDIYYDVCINLGSTHELALLGKAPCPYTHELKDIKGFVRSWIEERSPHSRQHYFRNGKRVRWDATNPRNLLFVNPVLGTKNDAVAWMPYNTVRGGGWSYNPKAANTYVKPSDEILTLAASMYRRTGVRGAGKQTKAVRDVVTTTRRIRDICPRRRPN